MNVTCVSGFLASDPTLKNGSVLTFRVAVDDRIYDSNAGEWRNETSFFDCVMFGKRAEAVNSWLKKGAAVAVQGRLKQNTWQTDSGEKRSRVEIVVEDVFSPKR